MRIAIMCSAPGGAGLVPYPVDLAICLKKMGHDVHGIHGSNREYQTGLKARLIESGISMHEVPFAEAAGLRGLLPSDHTLQRKLAEIEPQIVHSWGPRFAYQGRALRRGSNRPLHVAMIMRMGHDSNWIAERTGAWLANRYIDKVLANCQMEMNRLQKAGIRRDKLELMLAPISCAPILEAGAKALDEGRTAVLARFGLSPDRKYLGYFAHFRPVKRQDLLVRAFTRIAGEFPDWDLLLPGRGNLRLKSEALAQAIPDRVHFLGPLYVEHSIALQTAADAVAHVSEVETFGWSMLEALLLGKPAVLTRVGVGSEIERAGMAVTIEPGNLDVLTDALRLVMHGGPAILDRAARSSAWVKETFDTPVVATRILNLYQRML